jgi:hypothetical protein
MKPTKEEIKNCVSNLTDVLETCTDYGITYPSIDINDLRTVLAALEGAQADTERLDWTFAQFTERDLRKDIDKARKAGLDK